MFKTRIKLDNINSIKDFVKSVSRLKMDIDLKSGTQEVDAKSIMGVCSLDLTKPIELIAIYDSSNDLKNLLSIIEPYTCKA